MAERVNTQEVEQTAQTGAHSIYGAIERQAEETPEGVRWQTLDWSNQPHYHFSVFYGVAGITLFLSDYFRLTGVERARDLARGGLRWCGGPDRALPLDEEWLADGLVRGRTGVGLAWLRLAATTGDQADLAQAIPFGERLLLREPGPVTDWQDGPPGEGSFLLKLGQAVADPRFVAGAVRRGEWLADVAIRDGRGLYWPWQVDHPEFAAWHGVSFIPGLAGIAHYLLELYQVTGESRWADLAREAAETLRRQARPDHGGLNWPDTLNGFERGEARKCQWCYGASGVGIFLARAQELLGAQADSGGDPDYLQLAEQAAEATYQYGDVRHNPCQCHGLAGNAELLLELYRLTRRPLWLERAHDFARRMLTYRSITPEGDVWQSDDPGCHSLDFMFGAAGTGHFFLRLWQPDQVTRPLL